MRNIAIVEDNAADRERLAGYLKKYQELTGEVFEIWQTSDGDQFKEEYSPRYDIIFLDIEMPGTDGIHTAEFVHGKDPDAVIAFITHAAQYAVHGYRLGAVDYIMKPLKYEMFEHRMTRILRRVEKRKAKSVLLRTADGTYRVAVSDILYIEVTGHHLHYHANGTVITVKGTMKDAEKELADHGFAKSSNSFLVNLRYVREMRKDAVLVGSVEVPVSKGKRKEFLSAFASYIVP